MRMWKLQGSTSCEVWFSSSSQPDKTCICVCVCVCCFLRVLYQVDQVHWSCGLYILCEFMFSEYTCSCELYVPVR